MRLSYYYLLARFHIIAYIKSSFCPDAAFPGVRTTKQRILIHVLHQALVQNIIKTDIKAECLIFPCRPEHLTEIKFSSLYNFNCNIVSIAQCRMTMEKLQYTDTYGVTFI